MKQTFDMRHLLGMALMAALLVVGCKKEDAAAPTVSLNGAATMEIVHGTTFTDPGATANDETDGDLTSAITVSGSVNTSMAGSYTLTYTATDEAGNTASVDRMVEVVFNRDSYVDSYSCSENCQTPYGLNSVPNITAGATAAQVSINPFYFNGGTVTLTVDGSNITVDAGQSPSPIGAQIAGSGTMSSDGSGFSLNITFTDGGGNTESCVATYTK